MSTQRPRQPHHRVRTHRKRTRVRKPCSEVSLVNWVEVPGVVGVIAAVVVAFMT